MDALDEWTASLALTDLVEAFGGRVAPNDLYSRLVWLDEFSAANWDFRSGAERNLAARTDLAASIEQQTVASATALGLTDRTLPRYDQYDAVLILGGLVRACIVRARYAAILSERVNFGTITALGGFRCLAGDEPGLVKQLRLDGATTELDAMVAGVKRAFDLTSRPRWNRGERRDNDNESWAEITFEYSTPLAVIAAPSTEPEARRANTADTYSWWASQQPYSLLNRRILLITTSIYVPYQGAEALRLLAIPHGAEVDTVGAPQQVADLGAHTQVFHATNYLQEIRSTVRAYRKLADTLAGMQ